MTEITLYNGDCLQVMKDIPDKSIDLIICDLPYGCLTGGGVQKKTRRRFQNGKNTGTTIKQSTGVIAGCAWDVKINLEEFWKQVKRIRRSDRSPTIHFCTTKFGFELIKSNPDEFRYDLVWDKQRGVSFLSANKSPMRCHEMIYVFSKKGAFYDRKDIAGDFPGAINPKIHKRSTVSNVYPRLDDSLETRKGLRCALSVIKQTGITKKGNHPTEKPKELYKWLIERYCPEEGTVLDPTAGSFNSVFQAVDMNRNAIGIEKDEGYYNKALEKYNSL